MSPHRLLSCRYRDDQHILRSTYREARWNAGMLECRMQTCEKCCHGIGKGLEQRIVGLVGTGRRLPRPERPVPLVGGDILQALSLLGLWTASNIGHHKSQITHQTSDITNCNPPACSLTGGANLHRGGRNFPSAEIAENDQNTFQMPREACKQSRFQVSVVVHATLVRSEFTHPAHSCFCGLHER